MTVDEFVKTTQVQTPPDTENAEVWTIIGWDYELHNRLQVLNNGGWSVCPGTFQAVSLTGSGYAGSNAARPYIILTAWRRK